MVVVPVTFALALGLGMLIAGQLHTAAGHSAGWRTGWQPGQQHQPIYVCKDPHHFSMSSCRSLNSYQRTTPGK